MGFLDAALKRLRRGIESDDTATVASRPAESDYGRAGAPAPDLDALVSDAEIAAIAGAAPVGAARRNGDDGSETDLGRLLIRECKLTNGDTFLISIGNCATADGARLAMDRMAGTERPLSGVGERALVRVERHAKAGTSEVGVTALQGNFTVALVHTSTAGVTDPEPLTQLLRRVLTRL